MKTTIASGQDQAGAVPSDGLWPYQGSVHHLLSACAKYNNRMARRDLDEWLLRVESEMQRLSAETAHDRPKLARHKGWAPRVDVLEAPTFVVVKAELAGVRNDQVSLHYCAERNTLGIRGQRQEELADIDEHWAPYQLEIDYGDFAREVRLPEVELRFDEARAQFRNGILLVVIPKAPVDDSEVVYTQTISIKKL